MIGANTTVGFDSARLRMRTQRMDDAEALHAAYQDEDLMRYWSSAPHATLGETRAYLTPHADDGDWRGWSITLKGDDRAIGTLAAVTRRSGVAEIGYLLIRAYWGHGYAREAVAALIDTLFAEGHRRIYGDVDPENAASIHLMESLGFQREGLLRGEWETHIGVRDSLIFGLLRDEWVNRPRARAPGSSATRR